MLLLIRTVSRTDRKRNAAVNVGGKTIREISTGSGFDVYPIGGKWGFTDKTGKIIVEPQYLSAEQFSGGLAMVIVRTEDYSSDVCYIDKTGKYAWKPTK